MKRSNHLRRKVVVSAPGKLMLFGEHSVVYGRPCIVTAVDERMRVTVEKISGDLIIVDAPDLGIKHFTLKMNEIGKKEFPKGVSFVLGTIKNFYKIYKVKSGLKIKTKSEFSSLFGFGSSSAVTICMVKALSKIFDVQVSDKDMFDMAYKSVLDVQGVGSGFDVAAAIWGGTIYFEGWGKVIVPLKTRGLPLTVGYTGIKADTATLIRQVGKLYKSKKGYVDDIFDSIDKIVKRARKAFEKSDFKQLGVLMNEDQELLKYLGVSSKELDNLIGAAIEAGAYGAKLSGAGGGDCMIAFSDDKYVSAVKKQITMKGGTIINVKTGAEGVRVESV